MDKIWKFVMPLYCNLPRPSPACFRLLVPFIVRHIVLLALLLSLRRHWHGCWWSSFGYSYSTDFFPFATTSTAGALAVRFLKLKVGLVGIYRLPLGEREWTNITFPIYSDISAIVLFIRSSRINSWTLQIYLVSLWYWNNHVMYGF